MMDDAWFRRQVGRHTNSWRDQPREFARRTAMDALIALGTLVGLSLLLLLSAVLTLIVWWRSETGWPWLLFGLLIAAVAWPLVRALRLKASPAPGVAIGPQQAKEIHALVQKARDALGAATIDEIRFDVSPRNLGAEP